MKILISGGHLTPALAFIDYVKNNHSAEELTFVGRLVSQESTGQPAREKKEVEKRQVTFIPFKSPKFSQTKAWYQHLILPCSLLKAVYRAGEILDRERPDVFLSFGGYLAVPLALAAHRRGITILTHEQTRAPGLANRILAKLADRVAVSWPETKDQFPTDKTSVTGNPVRAEILEKVKQAPGWFNSSSTKPILLVTGGSQGSQVINQLIEKLSETLQKTWTIIHLTGQKKDKTARQIQTDYYRAEWLTGRELAWLYTQAHIAIARAGANTCLELTLRQIPTLYIPLPFARGQEQLKNAQALTEKGAALILTQDQLNSAQLLAKLNKLETEHDQFQKQLAKIQPPTEAAVRLYQLLQDLVHES